MRSVPLRPLALLHRRLTVLMALAALLAFGGGAGVEPLSALMALAGLVTALFWQPDPRLSQRLEHVWLPLALLLVGRSLFHMFAVGGDVVVPVVDLLLLLMVAESLRSLDAPNDARIYALSFALLLAATAYRPGLVFALAFVAYVGLATASLFVGTARREAARHGAHDLTLDRRLVWRITAFSATSLVLAVAVFLTFPRVNRAWPGRGSVPAASIVGFADQVSIGEHGARIQPNPQIVLRVEFPDGRPPNVGSLYWRGRSYDRFDGVRWSRSRRLPPSLGRDQWYASWGPGRMRQRIYATPLDARVLFATHPALELTAEGDRIHPVFDNAGDFTYFGSGSLAYEAISVSSRPSAEALRAAVRGWVPARNHYTQLPPLDPRVARLADSLTAGLTSNYDRAVAIERFFHDTFDYTLDLPATAREATLEHFLFQRRAGHCEYFSTAMVVLLRSLGIAAREVNGFLGGQWNEFGGYLAVTQNEAHSWVEVWFPGQGWVPFDPTPAARGSAEARQTWYWPGKFLLDGLQHRWSKWILDYDIESQSALFQRLAGVLQQKGGSVRSEGMDGSGADLRWLWTLLIVSALWTAARWARAGDGGYTEPTRLYLRLVAEARRADLPAAALRAPADLVDTLRAGRHPAARAAERLVDYYQRARFGGVPPTDEELGEMRVAFDLARRALRDERARRRRSAGLRRAPA
ncbi:MAG: DUF3488 domain-containing protein [Gemmatimonadetes bacterium]|nr:MAG: DUF3488 domain-containing protein [Gemmatimonadota bacterium]